MRLYELMESTITMYHGGRGLEYTYREMLGNKSKQTEYGPGLYLTNNFETAQKYAKGGGSVYRVTFKRGRDIANATLDLDTVMDFVKRTKFANRKKLIADLESRKVLRAETFLILLVNGDCLTPSTSILTRQFFVDSGIDLSIIQGFGANRSEVIAVIFNPEIIEKVERLKARDISVDDYILPV